MSNTINTTNHAAFVPEIWAKVALGAFFRNSRMAGLVYRGWSAEVGQMGDTIHIPKRGALEVKDKAVATPIETQQPSGDTVDIVLDKHKYVSFIVEDSLASESAVNTLRGYIEDAMVGIAKQVDTDLLSLYASMSTSVGTGGAGLVNADKADSDTILEAMQTLDENEIGDDRILIVHPAAKTDLLKCEKFVTADKVGTPDAIRTGAVGSIYGFDVLDDPRVISTGVSPTTYHNIAFSPYGLALVTKPLPKPQWGVRSAVQQFNNLALRLTYGYDMDNIGNRVTIDILYGVGIVRQEMVMEVLS